MPLIRIDLPPARREPYAAALASLPGVTLADAAHTAPADAVITGADTLADHLGDHHTPVLLDSPSAATAATLQALRDAASPVTPALPWRFDPAVTAVRDALDAGQLGRPGLLRLHHWVARSTSLRAAAFGQVDLALWLFNASPATTFHLTRDHLTQFHLGFPAGGMALVHVATVPTPSTSYHSLHLVGSDGAAYSDDHQNTHLLFSHDGTKAHLQPRGSHLAFRSMLTAFLAPDRTATTGAPSLAGTIATLDVLDHA